MPSWFSRFWIIAWFLIFLSIVILEGSSNNLRLFWCALNRCKHGIQLSLWQFYVMSLQLLLNVCKSAKDGAIMVIGLLWSVVPTSLSSTPIAVSKSFKNPTWWSFWTSTMCGLEDLNAQIPCYNLHKTWRFCINRYFHQSSQLKEQGSQYVIWRMPSPSMITTTRFDTRNYNLCFPVVVIITNDLSLLNMSQMIRCVVFDRSYIDVCVYMCARTSRCYGPIGERDILSWFFSPLSG